MSGRLPAELLLDWGEPVWRLRDGVSPIFAGRRAGAPVASEDNAPQNPGFAGFFVPEALDAQESALLSAIERVFPQLGARCALEDPAPLLEADGGRAVIFGEADWLADADELPVRLCVVPALGQMLEDPLAKKRAYLALLNFLADA
ncbi:hypothetical protein [Sulfurivirga sp.]|uniref:hypothetical protein n=1 Tax=Sulfurivirga sp. TaxID=2614236 RepID=UPI0025EEFA98|nr:hypothetical protein [Sulfurivirga sp.]